MPVLLAGSAKLTLCIPFAADAGMVSHCVLCHCVLAVLSKRAAPALPALHAVLLMCAAAPAYIQHYPCQATSALLLPGPLELSTEGVQEPPPLVDDVDDYDPEVRGATCVSTAYLCML
jgi:hypothetical protein